MTAKRSPHDNEKRKCTRCGVDRQWRTGRGNLCKDCNYVLTRTEQKAWA